MSDKQKDYTRFDQMSTEELEGLLREDFESDEPSDTDAILYIMEVIARRNKETGTYTDADTERAWKSFNENYRHRAHIVQNDTAYVTEQSSKPVSKKRIPIWLRITGAAAVLAVVLFCGTATNASGFNLFQIVAQWTSETFGFSQDVANTQDTPTEDGTNQYSSLQEALRDHDITEKLVPTWVPDIYELASVEVTESPDITYFVAYYEYKNRYITITIKNIEGGDGSSFEKDGSDPEIFEYNGIKYYLMSNLDDDTAVWTNKENECSITATVSRDELKKMIQSIYE